ncbi:MAG: hypothetical protein QHI48_00745 [Bacteroidota bacterium]|nr:hypothetical protein [Bacteroidota bacterium]
MKRFFIEEGKARLQKECERVLQSPFFDYSDAETRSRIEGAIHDASGHALFPRNEYLSILDQSVKLIFNYMCRPQWTLTKHVFVDTETTTVSEALEKMEVFSDYGYYKSIMDTYFKERGVTILTREKFEETLAAIDREIVRNLDSRGLAHLSEPLFALFDEGGDPDFARAPIEALSIFYDDKDIKTVVDALERKKPSVSTLSMHELIMLIGETDFMPSKEIEQIVKTHIPYAYADLDRISKAYCEGKEDETGGEEEDRRIEGGEALPTAGAGEDWEETVGGERETPDFSTLEMEAEKIETASAIPLLEEVELPEEFIPQEDRGAIEEMPQEISERFLGDKKTSNEEEPLFKDLGSVEISGFSPAPVQEDIERLPDIVFEKTEGETFPAPAYEDTQPADEVMTPSKEKSEPIFIEDEETTASGPPPEDRERMPERARRLDDLNTMIDAKHKKMYIKKLFQRDVNAYTEAIDTLNNFSTWREALEYLDGLFAEHEIDPHSRPAVKFYDDVFRRYKTPS